MRKLTDKMNDLAVKGYVKGMQAKGKLAEVFTQKICGYGAEDPDFRGGGCAAAGRAVYAVQGYHSAYPDPEDHQPVQLPGIRLTSAAGSAL